MGDAVLRGANFADVARTRSQGPTAAIGGQYDWTSEGSLASEILDRAIFTLPVGRMSQILDDGRGPTMSIIRVIERTEAGRQAFTEVQSDIKEKLKVAHIEKDKEKLHEYVAKLRDQIPIWTIYDDEPTGESTTGTASPNQQAGTLQLPRTNTTMRPRTPGSDKPPAPILISGSTRPSALRIAHSLFWASKCSLNSFRHRLGDVYESSPGGDGALQRRIKGSPARSCARAAVGDRTLGRPAATVATDRYVLPLH